MPSYVVGTVERLIHIHRLPHPTPATHKTDDGVPLVLPIMTPITASVVQNNDAVIVVNVAHDIASIVGSLLARDF